MFSTCMDGFSSGTLASSQALKLTQFAKHNHPGEHTLPDRGLRVSQCVGGSDI